MKTLEELRKDIDSIDDELLKILAKRAEVVSEIGAIKKEQALPILDEERWRDVLKSRIEIAKSLNLPTEFIEKLYELIHTHSLDIEKNI